MGEVTKILWTDHTFNPWRGCTKVSPGCAYCYAEAMSLRNPAVLGIWGDRGTRVVAAEAMWRQPLRWDKAARETGVRRRVFCASLGDVFEDNEDLVNPRIRLFDLMQSTPSLDWLLLTKRPEHARAWLVGSRLQGLWPLANVWLGTSVENQATADERIPILLSIPAKVRFLSMEPLLGPVDLTAIGHGDQRGLNALTGEFCYYREHDGEPCSDWEPSISWVIVGGESGPKARPFDLEWARSIRNQCAAAGVKFFMKQLGANAVTRNDDVADWFGECGHLNLGSTERFQGATGRVFGFHDSHGADWNEWPADLRVREYPSFDRA